jgi:hypothetical protein
MMWRWVGRASGDSTRCDCCVVCSAYGGTGGNERANGEFAGPDAEAPLVVGSEGGAIDEGDI